MVFDLNCASCLVKDVAFLTALALVLRVGPKSLAVGLAGAARTQAFARAGAGVSA